MKLKLEHGTKLKDAPVEYRLALRLVTIAAQKQNRANFDKLAAEIGASYNETLKAANELHEEGHVHVSDLNLPGFAFEVKKETALALARDAGSYRRMMESQKEKPKAPALPPIDEAVRSEHLDAAATLARKLLVLEKKHAAWQLAGCIARLGLAEIERLVEETCAKEHDVKVGVFRDFFDAYCAARDTKISAPVESATAELVKTQ